MGATRQSKIARFIGDVALDMADKGWKLHLVGDENVYTETDSTGDESKCIGYTLEDDSLVVVAMNSERWLYALIHEYAHFRLYHERTTRQVAKAAEQFDSAMDTLTRWVESGQTRMITEADAWAAAKAMAKEEAAAEARALKLVDERKLPVDRSMHIRTANAYVLSHGSVVTMRRWQDRDAFDDEEFRKRFSSIPRFAAYARTLKTSHKKFASVFTEFYKEVGR